MYLNLVFYDYTRRLVRAGLCVRCEPPPCEHMGICSQDFNQFHCDCGSTGYGGAVCHICECFVVNFQLLITQSYQDLLAMLAKNYYCYCCSKRTDFNDTFTTKTVVSLILILLYCGSGKHFYKC